MAYVYLTAARRTADKMRAMIRNHRTYTEERTGKPIPLDVLLAEVRHVVAELEWDAAEQARTAPPA